MCFFQIVIRNHTETTFFFTRPNDHRQNSGNCMNFSVQANLSGHHYISQLFRRKYSGSRKYSRCQRKIKTCALLPDIRRCQIYGDSLGRERDPVILEGCTYTILRFFYLGRWQSDHSKGRKSITYICFNLYKMNFHPRNSC